ncbi:2Fe-2S iron-sulfur cluster-binding protein [Streptomyces sp. NPDC091217]|uniref:2Fe-2S iron-sulfur cluster-binding protein n=1 Tax=Streptomyces sp. NPDC091217 TaxID=3365975 RepID=UPI003804330C
MIIIDRNSTVRELDPEVGKPLMHQLRPLRVGVVGLCNGNAACGTCHVYVEESRLDELPEPDEYEEEMLADLPSREKNSRLSCQLVYQPFMADLTLTVAPR